MTAGAGSPPSSTASAASGPRSTGGRGRHRQQGRERRPARGGLRRRPAGARLHLVPGRRRARPRAAALGRHREWVWILHDDANPDPGALAALLAAAAEPTPTPTSSARSCASGPRCGGCSSSASRSPAPAGARPGSSAASTTRASTTRSARCSRSTPPACWCAARCSRSSAASTASCRSSATTSTSAGAPPRPATAPMVVPQAVVFHAEAAHRGIRRTPLTGRHTHYQERRAALYTLLANARGRALPCQVVRLAFGTLLRMIGFLLVRSVGEALDELAALVSLYSSPRRGPRRPAGPPRAARSPTRRAVRPPAGAVVGALPARARLRRRPARRGHQPGRRTSPSAAGPPPPSARPASTPAPAALGRGRRARRGHRRWSPGSSPTRSPSAADAVRVLVALVGARDAFGSRVRRRAVAGPGRGRRLVAAARRVLAPARHRAPRSRRRRTCCRWRCWRPCSAAARRPRCRRCCVLAVPLALWGAWRFLRVVGRLVDATRRSAWAAAVGCDDLRAGAGRRAAPGATAGSASVVVAATCCRGWPTPRSASPTRTPTGAGAPRGACGLLLALAAAFAPVLWLFAARPRPGRGRRRVR